jgi:acetylornithine deacetylase/succinyl-diaminopimelate desuccinylase-like protein
LSPDGPPCEMTVDPLPLLKELVSIPSVNPMGRNVSGSEFLETRLTEFLERFFHDLNVPFEIIEVMPGRSNIIARFDNPQAQATILMDAHQDTVPTDGMIIPPFFPEIRNGRLYGRGSCDVKGGMAAMLSAFSRLVKERPVTAANVIMSCTCDEECTAQGVTDLAKLWSNPDRHSKLISGPPDIALVAEPTDLHIVVAHRGATRWKIQTSGKAAHSSRPSEGVNAIYRMAPVLLALENYARDLPGIIPAHPLCGPATLSVGRIEGGISVNTVPDSCAIEIDRRVLPGEDGVKVIQQVEEYLRHRLDVDFKMLPPWIIGQALSNHNNGPWSDHLLQVIERHVGVHEKVGVPYGTNASRTSATGVPSMVFGPGSIYQAHTSDEWILISELREAAEIYFDFCANAVQPTL